MLPAGKEGFHPRASDGVPAAGLTGHERARDGDEQTVTWVSDVLRRRQFVASAPDGRPIEGSCPVVRSPARGLRYRVDSGWRRDGKSRIVARLE
jgi:hypothetical protein